MIFCPSCLFLSLSNSVFMFVYVMLPSVLFQYDNIVHYVLFMFLYRSQNLEKERDDLAPLGSHLDPSHFPLRKTGVCLFQSFKFQFSISEILHVIGLIFTLLGCNAHHVDVRQKYKYYSQNANLQLLRPKYMQITLLDRHIVLFGYHYSQDSWILMMANKLEHLI